MNKNRNVNFFQVEIFFFVNENYRKIFVKEKVLEIFFRGKMAAVVYEASATIKIIEKKMFERKKSMLWRIYL